jgi:hypothetical protein
MIHVTFIQGDNTQNINWLYANHEYDGKKFDLSRGTQTKK